MMTKPANDDGNPAEALIAVESLSAMLEMLILNPDARPVLSHLKILQTIVRVALDALRPQAGA